MAVCTVGCTPYVLSELLVVYVLYLLWYVVHLLCVLYPIRSVESGWIESWWGAQQVSSGLGQHSSGFTGFTLTHLGSLGLTSAHLDSLKLNRTRWHSLGSTWRHLDTLGLTSTHFDSFRIHSGALGLTVADVDSLGIPLASLGPTHTQTHLGSSKLTWAHCNFKIIWRVLMNKMNII